MHNASGTWISFVDSDDELELEAYEVCAKYFGEKIDSIWFKTNVVCNFDEKLRSHTDCYINNIPLGQCYVDDLLLLKLNVYAWSKLYKKSIIEKYNITFPEGCYYEDAVFYYNFFSIAKKIYATDNFLYNYYMSKNSIMGMSRQKKENVGIYHIIILDYIFQFWKTNGLLSGRQKLFESIVERYIKLALYYAPDSEKSRCIWEGTKRLRNWDLLYESKYLQCLKEGQLVM